MKTIYAFEVGRWFNKPLFYIYCVILTGIGALFTASAGGVFDDRTATVSGLTYINSPLQIAMILGSLSAFAFFLLPSIIGSTVQKDYQSNMYQVLYSYPFKKSDYIFGKFFAGLTIALFIMILMGMGMQIGTSIPGVDQSLVAPFSFTSYLQAYGIFVIPNLILFSAIVFSVTLFTRSVIAGFVALAVLYFGQSMADIYLADQDYTKIGAYLDPFGLNAVIYYTKYWTIFEQNENMLPIKSLVIQNRLIWTGISILIFAFTYIKFQFHSQPINLKWWKTKGSKPDMTTKAGLSERVTLPPVHYNYGFLTSLQSIWRRSRIELKYILKGGPFIVIVILAVLFMIIMSAAGTQIYQTSTLPVTREILGIPGTIFRLFIVLLTFIYAGRLSERSRSTRVYQLEDASSVKTWSYLASNFLSITVMQMVLLAVVILTGIGLQIYKGYYNFELDLYLTDLYGVRLINYVIWSMLALMVYAVIPNFYLGLFLLLAISIGTNFLDLIGVEQSIYKYNEGPGASYSDMSGFGSSLPRYFIYKVYWLGLGLVLLVVAYLFWNRGEKRTFKQSWSRAKSRFGVAPALLGIVGLVIFVGLGSWIYTQNNIENDYVSSKVSESRQAEKETLYKRYQSKAQPRIVDVYLDIDLYTSRRDIRGTGSYQLVNKTSSIIDTIYLDYNELTRNIKIENQTDAITDSIHNIMRLIVSPSLMPGDTTKLTFDIANKENTLLRKYGPVRKNGTFFNNSYFPSIGYEELYELTDNKTRTKYELPPKERYASPTDSTALGNNYISNDADWLSFEAIVSTASDQIAMVPGKLQREWAEDGQRHFHYKMQSKMLNFYNVISARYTEYKDSWEGIPITIYHHASHDYNLERMMKGAKDGLAYCSQNFSPYQHDQLRILEFPITGGGFAQSFANTVPFSEGIGFIADVDDEDDGVNYPYSITAHEVAHQWWAHQVIGAKVQGATVMSESLSEYVSLKVLEHEHGEDQMRTFLKDALDRYLFGRTVERKKEQPLAYVENQQHIHYNKGALIFYALSDYIGEDLLNSALRSYVADVAFQEPPYTTCLELLDYLYEVTPDSLDYFVEDGFEHITAYDNRVTKSEYEKISDESFVVEVDIDVIKYRADDKGKRIYENQEGKTLEIENEGSTRTTKSYPLSDYIDVGVFGVDDDGEETVLYLRKHKISDIKNNLTIEVNSQPVEVGIDPYNKLIDTNSNDNRRKVEEVTNK